jgi:hypothetical protein
MKELLNKQILAVLLDKDLQHFLVFKTNEGDVKYETFADCCSETWFSDIIGLTDLIGETVNKVEEVLISKLGNYNTDDGRGRQDVDQVYGYKLMTNRGHIEILFRNSSNGYYGGWIECVPKVKRTEWNSKLQKYCDVDVSMIQIKGDYKG